MTEYVAGFLFKKVKNFSYFINENRFTTEVALIKKIKPEWQNGLLNGVGGKVEPGETPLQAMVREFKEETGETILGWKQFATLSVPVNGQRGGTIYLFTGRNDEAVIKTVEKEEVGWYDMDSLPQNVVPNLHFLVPMAYNFNGTVFELMENS